MALAIVLVALLIGSIIFNFVNPWQATPIASNWGSIDTTIVITLAITGIFFVAITLFIAYVLVRYRHRGQPSKESSNGRHQAAYKPDNKKLEWGLTALTTVGICSLLAPGLIVYDQFVTVPKEAGQLEAVARQWMWRFRLPGEDGELGATHVSFLSVGNPLGIDPDDPQGQDDLIVNGNELHLSIDQPMKFLLRALDVLHDFYVPHFRAKMDMVPGQVSYFWMTPTKLGRYEILCAEYCGIAHYNMRASVVVDSADDYQSWLAQQPTFAQTLQQSLGSSSVDGLVEQGRQLADSSGCFACHSIDGSKSLGPGWQGIFGSSETLADDSSVVVDDAYFRESVLTPSAKMVKGYLPVMVAYPFSDEQLQALIAYVRSLEVDLQVPDSPAAAGSDQTVAVEDSLTAAVVAQENSSANGAARGEALSQTLGCIACHSVDGSKSLGPSWKGMYGRTEQLQDGSSVVVDDAYIRESIAQPAAKLVQGFLPLMISYELENDQIDALIEYAKSMAE